MIAWISWYLVISLLGWLAFPLAFRLMPALKDRGYAICRALGLLLWGYVFWLLASLGFVRNESGGLLLALALLAGLSVWALRSIQREEFRAWLRQQRFQVLTVELLFLAAFAGWAIVRSANPEAVGTEKPMELAFINAILGSPTFPPHDPWLSGFAISYYYFGYVLVAMLARLTGTPGAVAFNLGVALIFALSAIGAYGVLYNLLSARLGRRDYQTGSGAPGYTLAALFGPLFVLFVSNLEGFLQMLYTRGLFWHRDASGQLVSSFWSWLDIKDLNVPPTDPFSWIPTRFWWWWRASRVVMDYNLAGEYKEIIDEFPFFSYLLSDLHPHVLVMPFTFLAITLALNVFLGGARGRMDWLHRRISVRTLAWVETITGVASVVVGILVLRLGALKLKPSLAGLGVLVLLAGGFVLLNLSQKLKRNGLAVLERNDLGEVSIGLPLHLNLPSFLLAAVVLGGMAFLNTWDFPVYVALFAAAYALYRLVEAPGSLADVLKDFVVLGIALAFCGGVLYLPFYLGFSSQAGGILPNLINPTRGAQFWVMFGPLMLPIFAFLIYLVGREQARERLAKGFAIAIGLALALWIISLFLGFSILMLPSVGDFFISASLGSLGNVNLVREILTRRVVSIGGLLTMLTLLGLSLTLLLEVGRCDESQNIKSGSQPESNPLEKKPFSLSPGNIFTVLLAFIGGLLVLAPEFVYLFDRFGWRMNTIFKFYYQAWLLWAIAAAYGAILLLGSLRRWWGAIFSIGLVLLLLMALAYPVLSLPNKIGGLPVSAWTLDSTAYFASQVPDEMAAVHWLQKAQPGVIAEAVPPGGGSYTQYARISTLSGLPAVLGWVGHEDQWRSDPKAIGSRQGDLERLYCSRDWTETKSILDQYSIRYVFVGGLERATYQPGTGTCSGGLVETKFTRNLNPVFQQGAVTIYEYAPPT